MSDVVGRDAELAAGERFLDAVEKSLAVCVFEGEAGIGKTTVWSEVRDRARERGFRVLSCRPAEAEGRLSLSALADLLAPVRTQELDPLPSPQRLALDVALLRVQPGEESADRRALATGVLSLLGALAQTGTIVVAIDDVQWLDADSAAVVEFVLRRIDATERIGFLFARRVGEPTRLEVDRVVDASVLSRLSVGPLTLAAMHHLLDRAGEAPSRSMLVRIHDTSGGNPLFALEIARAVHASGVEKPGALPVPEDLRQLITARVSAVPEDAREALLAIATLSAPTSALVEQASSSAGIDAAEQTGLLRFDGGKVSFAHPLYASAVYGGASENHRRTMHRRLAGLVSDPEEKARHLALADPDTKDVTVASLLEQAAVVARARGAWESAADLLERAAEFTPADGSEGVQRRSILAAEHYVRGGDVVRARTLLTGVLTGDTLSRPLRAEALRFLAEVTYNADNYVEGKKIYGEALEYADDPRQRVLIEFGIEYVSVAGWLDFEDGVVHAHRALELAESLGDDMLVGQALALCAIAEFHAGRDVDWDKLERAVELEDPEWSFPHDWRAGAIKGILLSYSGRLSEAREWLLAVRAQAAERGDEAAVAFIVWWLAVDETFSGNLDAAAAFVDEAATLSRMTNSRPTLALSLAVRSIILAFKGEAEEARRTAVEALEFAQQAGLLTPLGLIAWGLGWLELALGDHQAAWRANELPVVALEYLGISEPALAFFLPEALEAMIALGDLDRAEKIIDQLEARCRDIGRTWVLSLALRCRGLLLAARGDVSGGIDAMDEAVAAFEGLDAPPFLARTLLARGIVLRRGRRRADAKSSFEDALRLFDAAGMQLWAERARQELERVGLRRASSDELTENERRVAELAAAGKTNRDIAEALFISPKTVEANLAAVYRKLGIRSRAELGAWMAQTLQK